MLAAILSLSLMLNLWGNTWGAPARWHPDELTDDAIRLVERRTIDPDFFAYGGLQHYVVALFGVLPVEAYGALIDRPVGPLDSTERLGWEDRQRSRMIVAARAISAILAALVVVITFVVGACLFGSQAGLISAFMLAIAMSWVQLAHFATVDIGATWWFWGASLCALLYWRTDVPAFGVAAAFAVGLAFGCKADRVVAVFPLIVAALLRHPRPRLVPAALVGGSMLVLGYVFANPVLVLSPFKYLDGFSRDLFFNMARRSSESGLEVIWKFSRAGLGRALFMLAGVGAGYGIVRLLQARAFGALLWMASTLLPALMLFANKKVMVWYVPFFFPPVMLLAGHGWSELLRQLPRRVALIAEGIGALIVARALWFTVLHIRLFAEDPRDLARRWVVEHVPPGATIEIIGNGPALPRGRYRVRNAFDRQYCHETDQTLSALADDRRYLVIRRDILAAEEWTRRLLGLVSRAPYEGWFDVYAAMCATVRSPPAIWSRSGDTLPDYVLRVGSAQSDTFESGDPREAGYDVAAEFPIPPGVDPSELIFLARPVVILRQPAAPLSQ